MEFLSRPLVLVSLAVLAASPGVRRQERVQEKESKTIEKEKPAEATPPAPKEESSVTEHTLKIGSQTIPYKATAATILLKNEKDEPISLIYHTAYTRSDVKDPTQRPLSFVYNGGAHPPSGCTWEPLGRGVC